MTTFIITAYIAIFALIAFTLKKLIDLEHQMSFNHGAVLGIYKRSMEDIERQLTEHQRKVGTFKTTVLTDMAMYHREARGYLESVSSVLKDEDYKNSDHLRKLIETIALDMELKFLKSDDLMLSKLQALEFIAQDKFVKIVDHVSTAANNVSEKVNAESEEIKDFIKLQHTTSVSNHSNADKKIEAVFQRVNNAVGLAKKIPSL
jgi:hypothetical protein